MEDQRSLKFFYKQPCEGEFPKRIGKPELRSEFFPKQGKSPRKHEVIFITPTGEEINHKRKLDQYLKAHPGSPAAAEFDWSTGETPRRSARISEKSKVTPPVEREHPKRRRSSVSKKDIKETEAEPEVLEEKKEIDNQDGEKHESMVDAAVKDEKVAKCHRGKPHGGKQQQKIWSGTARDKGGLRKRGQKDGEVVEKLNTEKRKPPPRGAGASASYAVLS
ncbi:Methyl-CpG-binding domain-containing protein 10, partial [Cucurbita argyrosperma subsp. argyrosperma]